MIVWLEDLEETIEAPKRLLEAEGVEMQILPSINSFHLFLDENAGQITPKLIVLDILVFGVNDLSAIGVKNAPTFGGSIAGFVLADRYIRRHDNPWRTVPIAFYSEQLREDQMRHIDELDNLADCKDRLFQKTNQQDQDKFILLVKKLLEVDS